MKKVTMIIDLQFGSTGKGLIAGYLAEKQKPDVVVTANMPNAGHTYIDAKGRKWVHKVLPNGIVSPNLEYILIGAGAVFDLERLEQEYGDSLDLVAGKVRIHENAGVLAPRHAAEERAKLSGISSTMQGSGAALADKMSRNPNQPIIARDVLKGTEWEEFLISPKEYNRILQDANEVLAEGAQGFSLSISERFYPYCTSRDCTPARFLADMNIPHKMLRDVVGTARCHPIRVGNTPDGYSGDIYSDQKELTWDSIGQEAELTTVTKRERRVFSFSREQIEDAMMACQPDRVFLNFCNYTEAWADVADAIEVAAADAGLDTKVEWFGFGADKLNVYTREEQL